MPFEAKLSRRSLLSAFALLPAARLLRGQQANTTFSADVKVVNLLATVRDKQGQIVRDLTKEDFLLDEDGRPQTISYFSRENDLPLTLGLLVDTSGSERREIPDERRASIRFFEQVMRPDKDQAFVIHFDFEVELLEDLTNSREKLEKALNQLDSPQLQRQQQGGGYPGGGYPGGGQRGGRGRRRRHRPLRRCLSGGRRAHEEAERPEGADSSLRWRRYRQQGDARQRRRIGAAGRYPGLLDPIRRSQRLWQQHGRLRRASHGAQGRHGRGQRHDIRR